MKDIVTHVLEVYSMLVVKYGMNEVLDMVSDILELYSLYEKDEFVTITHMPELSN